MPRCSCADGGPSDGAGELLAGALPGGVGLGRGLAERAREPVRSGFLAVPVARRCNLTFRPASADPTRGWPCVREVVGVDPVGVVAGIAQKNYQRWKTVQEEIFRNFLSASHHEREEEEERAETSTRTPRSPRR